MSQLTDLYRDAVFVRLFEEAMADFSDAGHVPGLLHLCHGSEVVEASICQQLQGPQDQVTGSHRSHGLALLMGADPEAVAAEILGLKSGLSRGCAGTQHLIAPEAGFLSSNGIVGAQVPLASGAALSAKTLGTGGIAVCFYGDGAANQGAVLESMNMTVALKLPLLFVMENNGQAQTTKTKDATGNTRFVTKAKSMGLHAVEMDGADSQDCLTVAVATVAHVRESGEPAFIEASVPRLGGHYHGASGLAGPEAVRNTDPLEKLSVLLAEATAESILSESKQKINHISDSIRAQLEGVS